MTHAKQNSWNTFIFLPNKSKPKNKLQLISSTKAEQLSINIELKNNVEIYTYIKGRKLFGFCVIHPSTEIRWHYQFKNMEELEELAKLSVIDNIKKQLRDIEKERNIK